MWNHSADSRNQLPTRVLEHCCRDLESLDADTILERRPRRRMVALQNRRRMLALYCMLHAHVLRWRDQALRQLMAVPECRIGCDVVALCADFAVLGSGAAARLRTLLEHDGCVPAESFFLSGVHDELLQRSSSAFKCRCDTWRVRDTATLPRTQTNTVNAEFSVSLRFRTFLGD
ncbi:MAG: hypothetical protein MHM6MM_005364 [Cercozoa sp. M6MM]